MRFGGKNGDVLRLIFEAFWGKMTIFFWFFLLLEPVRLGNVCLQLKLS